MRLSLLTSFLGLGTAQPKLNLVQTNGTRVTHVRKTPDVSVLQLDGGPPKRRNKGRGTGGSGQTLPVPRPKAPPGPEQAEPVQAQESPVSLPVPRPKAEETPAEEPLVPFQQEMVPSEVPAEAAPVEEPMNSEEELLQELLQSEVPMSVDAAPNEHTMPVHVEPVHHHPQQDAAFFVDQPPQQYVHPLQQAINQLNQQHEQQMLMLNQQHQQMWLQFQQNAGMMHPDQAGQLHWQIQSQVQVDWQQLQYQQQMEMQNLHMQQQHYQPQFAQQQEVLVPVTPRMSDQVDDMVADAVGDLLGMQANPQAPTTPNTRPLEGDAAFSSPKKRQTGMVMNIDGREVGFASPSEHRAVPAPMDELSTIPSIGDPILSVQDVKERWQHDEESGPRVHGGIHSTPTRRDPHTPHLPSPFRDGRQSERYVDLSEPVELVAAHGMDASDGFTIYQDEDLPSTPTSQPVHDDKENLSPSLVDPDVQRDRTHVKVKHGLSTPRHQMIVERPHWNTPQERKDAKKLRTEASKAFNPRKAADARTNPLVLRKLDVLDADVMREALGDEKFQQLLAAAERNLQLQIEAEKQLNAPHRNRASNPVKSENQKRASLRKHPPTSSSTQGRYSRISIQAI